LIQWHFAKRNIFTGKVAWNSYLTHGLRHIESNTGKSARQGNLRHPRLKSYLTVSEISLSCTFCRCLILFLTFISSCVLFDSYVLLADDHVNNVSYFPFMSIKKVIPYFCVLREGYYVIIWLIVRICVFMKDWTYIQWIVYFKKEKHGELVGQLT
jgi:hypothetical protein